MQGIFIQLHNLGRNQNGQAAPFLIMLIAVLLACMMLVFNVGKVSLTRVNTQNSADAGALAGTSMLASGENLLADYNAKMIGTYAAAVAFGAMFTFYGFQPEPSPPWGLLAAYAYYASVEAAQLSQFINADEAGEKACEEAKRMAYQYAFINAGVDEPKTKQAGESYEEWKERESNFQQWMKDGGYGSGIYSWEEAINEAEAQGLYQKSSHYNELKVDVSSPKGFTLYPAVAPLWLHSLDIWYVHTSHGTVITRIWSLPLVLPVLPAWIAWISPNDAEMSVTTTRVEPGADFDLWRMKMPVIASGARATTYGGNVYFRGYDSKLKRVW